MFHPEHGDIVLVIYQPAYTATTQPYGVIWCDLVSLSPGDFSGMRGVLSLCLFRLLVENII